MRIRLLPSSLAAPDRDQFLTSFIVNDTVAVDAGSLGFGLDAERQGQVRHVFLTHSHADHICSLPVFLENFHHAQPEAEHAGPTVYASEQVLDALTTDMFNNRVWPDLRRLAAGPEPYLRQVRLSPEEPVTADGLRVTPVPVDHVVPTHAFIVDDGTSAVVFGGDSGPVDRVWEVANSLPHLRAVFLEVTFPDDLMELAGITGHLTPSLFAREAAKLTGDVTVVAVHMRRHHRKQIIGELEEKGPERLVIGRPGTDYRF